VLITLSTYGARRRDLLHAVLQIQPRTSGGKFEFGFGMKNFAAVILGRCRIAVHPVLGFIESRRVSLRSLSVLSVRTRTSRTLTVDFLLFLVLRVRVG